MQASNKGDKKKPISIYRLPTPLTKFGKTKPQPDEILIGQYGSHTTPHTNLNGMTSGDVVSIPRLVNVLFASGKYQLHFLVE